MWNKKGVDKSLYVLLDIILLLMVAGSFSVFLVSVSKDTFYERSYLARDISLMGHTIYASPGEMEYNYYTNDLLRFEEKEYGTEFGVTGKFNTLRKIEYNIDLSLFDFFITNEKVKVKDKEIDTGSVSYPAYHNQDFETVEIMEPNFIYFDYKQGGLSVERR